MSDDIVLCDDKRCFNEQLIKDLNTLIDEQALEIQKLNTLVNNICADVSFMLYYMKSSGYQNMERHLPEYKMYLEAKEIVMQNKDRVK
jgi:uncharacterized coiled-coil protein SlyX